MYSLADVADQTGQCYVITGASAGIGAATARLLAARGAQVVMACRSQERAEAAAENILRVESGAKLATVRLDLADLGSVRRAAAEVVERFPLVHGLLNNAGVYRASASSPFAINHLGHFALTCSLINGLPLRHQQPPLRVVTVTSQSHVLGRTDWDAAKSGLAGYAGSKLANLLFALELERRCRAASLHVVSLACHPGAVVTNLSRDVAPGLFKVALPLIRQLLKSPEQGALPGIGALTDPGAQSGLIYVPGGGRGSPHGTVQQAPGRRGRDGQAAARLWETSVQRTAIDIKT